MPLPPFSAFPRLDLLRPDLAPLAAIAPGDRLAVVTGFRPDPDLSLPDSAAITVDNPQPGQTCELRLIGKGLDLDVASASLPLRDDVKLTFGATVQPDAREIELQVQFYIGGVLLGAASRSLPVGAIAPDETNPCRMGTDRLAPVDMTATVSYAADGKLQWILSAPRVAPLPSAPLPSTFPDARGFAANVLRQLEPLKYGGQEARNALESFGQEIADRMPAEFFRVLGMAAAVARGEGRLPSLLLLTDEVYIPWELALLETPLSAAAPPFLGAQVEMGRWVVRDRVQLPPYADCEVRRFPVFASQYGLASATKQRELTEALGERQTLVERYADWHAAPLQACRQDFQPLLAEPPTAGQAVHFAVHGLSDPEADRQQLVLEDQRIPPAALSGAYRCGQTPRFSFVFMNACQVGTPGHELGELAGFPGALVRAGCRGVVAPLWDVHDGAARQCAEAFYHDVFEQQLSVGAALRARRAAYGNESATPLAYVYYGHPGLKFTRGDADGK